MCTSITQDDFVTIHHELGHIYYYLLYWYLPYEYRTGANPGFHEAVGDTLALSVNTPNHLFKIGLLDSLPNNSSKLIHFDVMIDFALILTLNVQDFFFLRTPASLQIFC